MKTTNRIFNHLLGAALLLLTLFGSTINTTAQTPDARIVFKLSGQLHAMNPDGSGLVPLTTGTGGFPAWSFDKRYILFQRSFSDSSQDGLYIMESIGERNGGRTFRVASANGTGADWSPDGSMIVFEGRGDVGFGLWVVAVNADSGDVGQPVLIRPGGWAPSWSPDGIKIAFTTGAGIVVLDLDTGAELAVPGGQGPSWSPDGGRLAFRAMGPVTKARKTTWHPQIFACNADGTGRQQLTSQTDNVYFPRWSPDATELAFWHQDAKGANSIRKLDLATGDITLLKKGGTTLDWTP